MAAAKKVHHFIKPMLTTAVDKAFDSKEWIFELKLDGYRAIAETGKKTILLYSRNGISLANKYPVVVDALQQIKTEMILDGEIVLLNEKGRPDFQKLQHYDENKNYPLVYYVFDIISLKGKSLKEETLLARKKILQKQLPKSSTILYCDHIEEKGKAFFKSVIKEDLEGIIAKKADSHYIEGIRTKEWLKIKQQKTREVVIAGFTAPKGGRLHFGSLILAEYKGKELRYIGNAGTGFDDNTLKELMKKMKPLILPTSPFDYRIKRNGPSTWIKPVLVAEIAYAEVTEGGMLRHPVYKGLRPEKKAKTIHPETELPKATSRLVKIKK